MFATITLYRTRGDQIRKNGSDAFGLTVIPCALTSLVNLLGNLICPHYSALYLVESEDSRAACGEGAIFEGCVGKVAPNQTQDCEDYWILGPRQTGSLLSIVNVAPKVISRVIFKQLSDCTTNSRHSSILPGISFGPVPGFIYSALVPNNKFGISAYALIVLLLIFFVAAIVKFISIGQMLLEYGVCTYIS